MTREGPRRILLALDASPRSLASIAAAVELAEALKAEIEVLFVEDTEVLALAGHPSARQLDPLTGRLVVLDPEALERRLRAQAARIRASISVAVGTRGLAWSLRVERGAVVDRLLARARHADLVAVGRTGWSGSRSGFGSTTRALLAAGPAQLLLPGSVPRGAPVLALYDASAAALACLRLAAHVALRRRVQLAVLVAGGGETDAALLPEVAAQLAGRVTFHPLPADGASGVDAAAAWALARPCGLLVLPMPESGSRERLAARIERLPCPVLLGSAVAEPR